MMLAFLIGYACGGVSVGCFLVAAWLNFRAKSRWFRRRLASVRADHVEAVARLATSDADIDRLHCVIADRETELRLLRDILAERDAEIAMTRELAEHPIPLIRRAEPRPL